MFFLAGCAPKIQKEKPALKWLVVQRHPDFASPTWHLKTPALNDAMPNHTKSKMNLPSSGRCERKKEKKKDVRP
jgi:hypothetical protein